ncbi:hypothetical protein FRC01_006510 [Tulasnella sp. 417]|nr:hypothetical protein FRC01_006510 [Tulasnella sp. 417]
MINQRLRPICEQSLYRAISLYWQTRRSLRLLETFVRRPDLALLVRHLEIDASWFNEWEDWKDEMPSILGADGMDALALAKKTVSLCVTGVSDWRFGATGLRDVMSRMRLSSLEIELPSKSDPCGPTCILPPGLIDLGPDLLTILRAQPLLENFVFSERSIVDETPESIQSNIQDADIPHLRSLTARFESAISFLSAAQRLESLTFPEGWDFEIISRLEKIPASAGASIQNLDIQAYNHEEEVWLNLSHILAVFPNVRKLSVGVVVVEGFEVPSAKQLLNQLEVRYNPLTHQTSLVVEVAVEDVIQCKASCPMLETLTDPEDRVWTFIYDSDSTGGAYTPYLAGRLENLPKGFKNDLPAQIETVVLTKGLPKPDPSID